jgi:hypothetical protein
VTCGCTEKLADQSKSGGRKKAKKWFGIVKVGKPDPLVPPSDNNFVISTKKTWKNSVKKWRGQQFEKYLSAIKRNVWKNHL